MKVSSLFSGSKGNCTLVDLGTARLLIDAGGSAKAIEEALGTLGLSLADITAVFVTHEHSDHTHGLAVIAKKYRTPIHMIRASAEALGVTPDSPLTDCLTLHDGEFVLSCDGFEIEAFEAPHDSVACVGYRITCGDETVGIVTDLGYVTQRVYDRLRGCCAVMLEANHDCDMVRDGPYPAALKHRILSGGGHLSNRDCAEFAGALARSGTKSLLLAHLSCENNTPETALLAVRQAVEDYGVTVAVTRPDAVTEWL